MILRGSLKKKLSCFLWAKCHIKLNHAIYIFPPSGWFWHLPLCPYFTVVTYITILSKSKPTRIWFWSRQTNLSNFMSYFAVVILKLSPGQFLLSLAQCIPSYLILFTCFVESHKTVLVVKFVVTQPQTIDYLQKLCFTVL